MTQEPPFPEGTTSLVSKHLTGDVFAALKDRRTGTGWTLEDTIRSGVENPDSSIGAYAGDVEAYTVFAPLFDAIIEDYHQCALGHRPSDLDRAIAIDNPDPAGDFIVSSRIRVGRSLQGYRLPPGADAKDRHAVFERATEALAGLDGRFEPLAEMSETHRQELVRSHVLFRDDDRFLRVAGAYGDWPADRGLFLASDGHFSAWVNEEDHLRLISMRPGGDLGAVFETLRQAVVTLSERLDFARDDQRGFITSCPTNLGTSMRASVHVALPKLAARRGELEAMGREFQLSVRGTHGEHTEAKGGVFDVSNKRRLGVTEHESITIMAEGVRRLIEREKTLAD